MVRRSRRRLFHVFGQADDKPSTNYATKSVKRRKAPGRKAEAGAARFLGQNDGRLMQINDTIARDRQSATASM